MSKKMSPGLIKLIINAGAGLVKIIGRTWKYELLRNPYRERVIYVFWHRNILPLMYLHRNQGIAVLISKSQDGDLIAGAAEKLGYVSVRGSSNRGGSKAARDMLKYSKKNTIGITPDGPKGPPKKIKDGLVFVAKMTKLPVVLVTADVNKEKVFKSWDGFRLPYLFAKIKVLYGEKIFIDRETDNERARVLLENEMKNLELRIKVKQV